MVPAVQGRCSRCGVLRALVDQKQQQQHRPGGVKVAATKKEQQQLSSMTPGEHIAGRTRCCGTGDGTTSTDIAQFFFLFFLDRDGVRGLS